MISFIGSSAAFTLSATTAVAAILSESIGVPAPASSIVVPILDESGGKMRSSVWACKSPAADVNSSARIIRMVVERSSKARRLNSLEMRCI